MRIGIGVAVAGKMFSACGHMFGLCGSDIFGHILGYDGGRGAEGADIYHRVAGIRIDIAHRGEVSKDADAAGFLGDSFSGAVGMAFSSVFGGGFG